MINFVAHNKIDRLKWDKCIRSSLNASVFVYSWYLDVVCKNWSALILGDYEAVFPLAPKNKFKINYLYQPFFTRYFGVYAPAKISEKLLNDFFSCLPVKYKYIQFCLHESNKFNNKNYVITERKFQCLDLGKKFTELQKEFSDNSKRNVKKALKAGLVVTSGIEPEKIVELFKSTKGAELEIFKPEDYTTLIRLMNICLLKNMGRSIAVYEGSVLCAAAFFMFTDNRFVFLKSGITMEGKEKGAMHLLFDYFIRENADQKYLLDFGGSSVDSVSRFYRNFGAKDYVYLQIKKNSLPRIVKWISGKS